LILGYLSLDDFSLQPIVLNFLDSIDLELEQLLLDDMGSVHFLPVDLLQFLSLFVVVLFHFPVLKFYPLLFYLFVNVFFSLFEVFLCLSFLKDIAQKHLRMECLYLVLRVMHFLIGVFYCLQSFLVR
jgi:hypothetical protein